MKQDSDNGPARMACRYHPAAFYGCRLHWRKDDEHEPGSQPSAPPALVTGQYPSWRMGWPAADGAAPAGLHPGTVDLDRGGEGQDDHRVRKPDRRASQDLLAERGRQTPAVFHPGAAAAD